MNEQNDKNKKPEEQKSAWSPLAIVAILIFTLAESGETALVTLLFTALIVGAMVYALYKAFIAFRRRRGGEEDAAAPASAARPAQDFPAAQGTPGEIGGEDQLTHDREQRLRQLDEWLESGLIDKKEYRELKERYERQT